MISHIAGAELVAYASQQNDIQRDNHCELAPFLLKMLQNRQHPKLRLTLRPAKGLMDAIRQRHRAEPAAAASEASRLVAWMLGAVPLCEAVDCLVISWRDDLELPWEPAFSAALAAFFLSLTSLTFQMARMSIGHLATVLTHPLLLPRLLHLDIMGADITHEGQLDMSPFIGSRVQKTSLSGWVEVGGERELLSGLVPLPPTLTQLEVTNLLDLDLVDWVRLAAAMTSLTHLQELRLLGEYSDFETTGPGPTALLRALGHLPSLHTLVMECTVVGQEQLDALLALTQIARLDVYGFSGLTSSQAGAACSWKQLEIWRLDWVSAAYLPLHSLTHPLQLHELVKDIEEPSMEVLAAAELNLCERNKAGLVLDRGMYLSKANVDLLTEQYLSHSRCTAQQPLKSTVASSRPEGHITPGGPGGSSGQGGQQGGPAAGGQALMQRLGQGVKVLHIMVQGLGEARLSSATLKALPVLFPMANVSGDSVDHFGELIDEDNNGIVSSCSGGQLSDEVHADMFPAVLRNKKRM
ncbi:hypothetical protein QJQ45_010629 [Haematococcus lacustris]|nr:hypothetical protein QJQ45_010629 [Haematococcus lacustris]